MSDFVEDIKRFHDLVNKRPTKKRPCLSCGKDFRSVGFGQRTCPACKVKHSVYGVRAGKVVPMNYDRISMSHKDNE